MNQKESRKRKRFVFYGRVQGVGFRYRACHAAAHLGLTGWVKNEWDDTVVMEVQGDEAAIRKMIDMIAQGNFISIERMEEREIPLEKESGFRVK